MRRELIGDFEIRSRDTPDLAHSRDVEKFLSRPERNECSRKMREECALNCDRMAHLMHRDDYPVDRRDAFDTRLQNLNTRERQRLATRLRIGARAT